MFKVIALMIPLFAFLSGCRTAVSIFIGNTWPGPSYDERPPPWAPAHGNRAEHVYRYKPYDQGFSAAAFLPAMRPPARTEMPTLAPAGP